MDSRQPALIFDLDGTLVDSVYFHAVWHQAPEGKGIDVPQWRIHRAVGMSGSFSAKAAAGFRILRANRLNH
jgi:beta-phosphoglucomutase-like phosphatase (HAD superfamily)